MMFDLRAAVPWRDLPAEYGNWNSVFRRFRRWCDQGVFDALLQTLVELGTTDDWQDQMIDSTSVRGSAARRWQNQRSL
jgi:transposase